MRIAMIEVGHWHAGMHLRSFQLADEVEIVGVSDHQPGLAAAFARQSGGRAFERYEDMLEKTKPDFVVAMGRHVDMPAIARYVLETGIPFAMEKPIGISAGGIAPLVELAEERNAFVAVPLINRYSALWRQLDELEGAGRVGVRSHYHFRVINGLPERYALDGVGWMLDPAVSGGGCMRNVGIHTVDGFLRFVQERGGRSPRRSDQLSRTRQSDRRVLRGASAAFRKRRARHGRSGLFLRIDEAGRRFRGPAFGGELLSHRSR